LVVGADLAVKIKLVALAVLVVGEDLETHQTEDQELLVKEMLVDLAQQL
jgi:hypothetical protein